jgi:transposase
VLADLVTNSQRKAHGKTPAFVSPLALAAVRRIDALFDIECAINGKSTADRLACSREFGLPMVAELEACMQQARAKLSGTTTSPRRWITCSSAGRRLRGSSTTD